MIAPLHTRALLSYHSVPSMQPLHLHIISQDFDSTKCVPGMGTRAWRARASCAVG